MNLDRLFHGAGPAGGRCRRWWGCALGLLGMLAWAQPQAAEDRERASTNAPSRLDYAAFRIIAERNIFNAGRSGRVSERTNRDTRRPARVDSFALVGTMSYEKGRFAFFDGSSSDYRKVLPTGGQIAGHKIKAIAPASVTLEAEGKAVELKVNAQLRREDDGVWEVTDRTTSDASSGRDSGRGDGHDGRSSSGPGSSGDSGTGGSGGGDASEVLKRLMEQREKELK